MDKNDNGKHISFYVRTIDNIFTRKIENMAISQGEDVTSMMYGWFLGYLYMNQDKDIYQKDLEKKFGLSRSAVTCIVKALEKDNCIRRESVEFDARLKKIVILERGIQVHKKSFSNIVFIDKEMEKNISTSDLDIVYKVMEQVKQNLLEMK